MSTFLDNLRDTACPEAENSQRCVNHLHVELSGTSVLTGIDGQCWRGKRHIRAGTGCSVGANPVPYGTQAEAPRLERGASRPAVDAAGVVCTAEESRPVLITPAGVVRIGALVSRNACCCYTSRACGDYITIPVELDRYP